MTDQAVEARARSRKLAGDRYPDGDGNDRSDLRFAFENGYMAHVREDDEPDDIDTLLACYHASGGFDVVRRMSTAQAGSPCRWMIGADLKLHNWRDVLARGYTRRVRLVEWSGS